MIDLSAALQHFSQSDPVISAALTQLMANNPTYEVPQKLSPQLYFQRICRSIVGQQLSVKAAATIWGRFEILCKSADAVITPQAVLGCTTEDLRAAGLSGQKTRYIQRIAEEVATGVVQLDHLDNLDDESVITELTKLYGIGRWSAEMFLLFTLARPNVFSHGDLGLKMGFMELYGHPASDIVIDTWSPYKSAASLTLWHYKDNLPQA